MEDEIECDNCGKKLKYGVSYCIWCGFALPLDKKPSKSTKLYHALGTSRTHGISPGLLSLITILVLFLSFFFLFMIAWRSYGISIQTLIVWMDMALTLTIFFLLGVTITLSLRNYFFTHIREFLLFASILSLIFMIGVVNLIITIILMDYKLKTHYTHIQYGFIDLLQFCKTDLIFPFFLLRSTGFDTGFSGSFTLRLVLFKGEYVSLSWTAISGNTLLAFFILVWNYFIVFSNFIILFTFALYFARAIWFSTPQRVKTVLYSITGLNFLFILVCFVFDLIHFIDRVIHYPAITIPADSVRVLFLGINFWVPTDFSFFILLPLIHDMIVFPSVILYSWFYLGVKMYRKIDPPNPTPRIIRSSYLWKTAIIFLMIFTTFLLINIPFVLMQWLEELNIIREWWLGGIIPPYQLIFLFLLFLCLIIILYPEGLLIFETHLYRAIKTYQKLEPEQKRQYQRISSLQNLEAYLKQIPPETLQELIQI